MGVKGLLAYLQKNSPSSFTRHELHNSFVVLDANSVTYDLYRYSRLKTQFNGEYLAFGQYVEKLIKSMRRCEITPIFVFEGLAEVSSANRVLNFYLVLNIFDSND